MAEDIEALIARRVQAVNQVYVTTPKMREAHELIARTRTARRQDGAACCCLIYGESGVGKSRIFDMYLANQPLPEPGTVPVLKVRTPAPFSMLAFPAAFLAAMGKPVIAGQDQAKMFDRVRKHLSELRTEVILLDEASHVVDRKKKGGAIPYWVTDTIKLNLLEVAKVPVAMNGVPAAVDLITMNPQLWNRRTGVLEIKGYDPTDALDWQRFLTLLELYERAAGFPQRVFPANEYLARRIHWDSDGINGRIASLVMRAVELATRKGSDSLTKEAFAIACAERAIPGKNWKNPFLLDVLPRKEDADESRETLLHKRKKAA